MKTYKPTKGRAVIHFADPFAEAKLSGLAMPETVESRRDTVGVVVDIHHRHADR